MAQVKGSAVLARLRWIRERQGEGAYDDVRARLSPQSVAAIDAGVLAHAWVPYSLFIELNVLLDRMFGNGDLRLCYELGRYGADVNLPTIYRIFLRFGNPMYMFGKASRLWQVNYDSGKMIPVASGSSEARLRIEAFEEPHRAHCLSVLGWASRAVELTGEKLLDAEEYRCRTRGDEACEMRLQWG